MRFLHARKRRGHFEETFSSLGPDNPGWDLGGWAPAGDDHTGSGSESIHAKASLLPTQMLPQTVRKTAAIALDLPPASILRYHRKLNFAVLLGEASFAVVVNDGSERTVDEESHAENFSEQSWVAKTVDLAPFGGRRVTLKFTVSITSRMNYMSSAEAWMDDIGVF